MIDNNYLTGNVNFLCERLNPMDMIAADCGGDNPELACRPECCGLCCDNEDSDCNDSSLLVNKDPVWEAGYKRYKFEIHR